MARSYEKFILVKMMMLTILILLLRRENIKVILQLNYGKKHRKLYVSNDEQSDGQDSVPEIITARPKRQKQRRKRKFIPHRDDSEKADEKDVSDQYITDPISMIKRKRSSESSNETIPVNKRYKLNLDKITEKRS